MTGAGVRGSIQALRELPDNPVAVLLARQERQSSARSRGWQDRPLLLTLAIMLMLLMGAFIWRQFWFLGQLPPGKVHPVFVINARYVAIGATLWYFALLYLLLASSRVMSGFQQGLMLLSARGVRGQGVRLDDLLRSAPIDTTAVINGLLWFHISRILRMLWLPVLGLAALQVVLIADRQIDENMLHLSPDWLYAIFVPLLAGLSFLLLAAVAILTGISLGRRLSWPAAAWFVFLSSAGLLGLGLFITAVALNRSWQLTPYAKTLSSPWQLLFPVFMLLALLLFVLLRRRVFDDIEASYTAAMEQKESFEAPAAQRPPPDRPAVMLSGLLAGILYGLLPASALLLWIHCRSLEYHPPPAADRLFAWYQDYLLELSVDSAHDSPMLGNAFFPFLVMDDDRYQWATYYDAERFNASEAEFKDDPRWYLLRFERRRQEESMVMVIRNGKTGSARYATPDGGPSALDLLEPPPTRHVSSPALEFRRLAEHWRMLELDLEYERQQAQKNPCGDAAPLQELLDERDKRIGRFREFAREMGQGFPLYWLAVQVCGDDPTLATQLIREGNALPCDTCLEGFLPEYLNWLSGIDGVEEDRILLGMLNHPGREVTMYGLERQEFRFSDYLKEIVANRDPAEMDAVHLMLQRLQLPADGSLDFFPAMTDAENDMQIALFASAQGDDARSSALADFGSRLASIQQGTKSAYWNSGKRAHHPKAPQALPYSPWQEFSVTGDNWLFRFEDMLSLGRTGLGYMYGQPFLQNKITKYIDHRHWLVENRGKLEELRDFSYVRMGWPDDSRGNP